MSYESEVQAANEAIADADALIQRLHDEIGKAEKARKAQDAATAMVDATLPKLEKSLDTVEANLDASASVNAKVKDTLDRVEADAANLVAVAKSTYADAGDAFLKSLADRVDKAIAPRVKALRERARLQTNEYSKYGKALAKLKKFLDRAEDAVKNGKADDADTALGDAKDESADLASNLQSSQFEVIRNHFEAKLTAQDARIPKIEADIAALRAAAQNTPKAQSAPAPASSTTSPSPLPPGVFPDSIAGSGMKVVNDRIGGSTGAKLVEIEGRRYILKQNRSPSGVYKAKAPSPEHVRNEAAADQAYRRAGIRVPDCRIYEEGGVTYKLSEFIPGGKSLGDYLSSATPAQKKKALDQLAEGYPLDALFGNRDAYGTANFDNILVDKDGNVWRIDNGSAFGFRARGLKKDDSEWKDRQWPDEWRTLRQYNQALFKDLDAHAIFTNFNRLDIDAALNGLPDDVKKAMEKPLAEMRELGARCTNFDVGGYAHDHTSEVLELSYDMTKGGVREALPKSQIHAVYSGYASTVNGAGWLRPPKTTKASAPVVVGPTTDAAKAILDAAKTINYHLAKKDGQTNAATVQNALDLKARLEAAAAWDKNAPTLLGYLKEIEASKANGYATPISTVDSSLAVDFTDPSKKPPAKKHKTAPTTQYSCFAEAVEKVASSQGIDVSRAIQLFKSQGGSSGSMGSCRAKVLELYAMGLDPSKPPKEVFMRSETRGAIAFYKKNPAELEADRRALAAWKAATQLVLENCDIPRADKTSRTVRLLRTMDSNILKYHPQEGVVIPYIPEGAHESYAADWVVTWSGHHLTVRDVPFSRITSTSYCTTTKNADLYLGDDENEFGANVVGLPCVYLGDNHSKGDPAAPLDALIDAAEKKSGRRMRDFKAP